VTPVLEKLRLKPDVKTHHREQRDQQSDATKNRDNLEFLDIDVPTHNEREHFCGLVHGNTSWGNGMTIAQQAEAECELVLRRVSDRPLGENRLRQRREVGVGVPDIDQETANQN
jgi:hypothetical protein